MPRSDDTLEKILIRSAYRIHFRRVRRANWFVESCPNYSAIFMLGGELNYECRNNLGTLNRHGGLLLNPGDSVSGRAIEAEFITTSISSSYVIDCAVRARLIRSGAVVKFQTESVVQSERLRRLSKDLREELVNNEAGQDLVISATIEHMIVELLRHHSHVRRADELELSRAGLVDRRIRRAVEFMHAQLQRELQLDEIAAAAYLSPFHFARLFKKLTGATPHAYLANLRTTRAQTLLAETDLTVTEVSARVGYASSSHFSKAFRAATGMTPRAFRAALIIAPQPRHE